MTELSSRKLQRRLSSATIFSFGLALVLNLGVAVFSNLQESIPLLVVRVLVGAVLVVSGLFAG